MVMPQLTLEQHGCELRRSVYTQIFIDKYSTVT